MPIFVLNTNVPKAKIPADFAKSLSALIAKSLHKPESYVCVHVNTDQHMLFGGTDAPCAHGSLASLGGLGPAENKKHSAAIFKHVNDHLGISGNRMMIRFDDVEGSNIGYNGSTF